MKTPALRPSYTARAFLWYVSVACVQPFRRSHIRMVVSWLPVMTCQRGGATGGRAGPASSRRGAYRGAPVFACRVPSHKLRPHRLATRLGVSRLRQDGRHRVRVPSQRKHLYLRCEMWRGSIAKQSVAGVKGRRLTCTQAVLSRTAGHVTPANTRSASDWARAALPRCSPCLPKQRTLVRMSHTRHVESRPPVISRSSVGCSVSAYTPDKWPWSVAADDLEHTKGEGN